MIHHQALEYRLVCLAVGYGFGSLLTAELVAKLVSGQSARQMGDGNPGMANIMMHLGKAAGFAVLAGDLLKTAAACGVGYFVAAPQIGRAALLYAGLGAILGHNHPLWSRGRGGKGVAVTCAWLVLYLPVTGALCCLGGGLLVLWLGYLPLGAAVIPLAAIPFAWLQYGTESGVGMTAAAIMMLMRHRHGLGRIRRGEEPRFFRRS